MMTSALILSTIVAGQRQGLPPMNLVDLNARLPGFVIATIDGKEYSTGPIVARLDKSSTKLKNPIQFRNGRATLAVPYTLSFPNPTNGLKMGERKGVLYEEIRLIRPTNKNLYASMAPDIQGFMAPDVETGDIEIGKDEDNDIIINNSGSGDVIIIIKKETKINGKKGKVQASRSSGSGSGVSDNSGQNRGLRYIYDAASPKWDEKRVAELFKLLPANKMTILTTNENVMVARAAAENFKKNLHMTIGLQMSCEKLGWNDKWFFFGQKVTGGFMVEIDGQVHEYSL